jgi:hypothetical protein
MTRPLLKKSLNIIKNITLLSLISPNIYIYPACFEESVQKVIQFKSSEKVISNAETPEYEVCFL